jgi:mannose-6-phosphate isomerase-like protein (cupin superfamily)
MTLAAYVRGADQHERISWIGDSTLTVLLDGAATGGQLMVVRSDARLGDAAPVHVHEREDESFLVLSGSLLVWSGDDRYEVAEGGICLLPRGVPHAYRVTSPTTTFLNLSTPAGLERAFREAGWSHGGEPPADWAVTPAAVGAAMAKVGCTVLGPPPAVDAPAGSLH